MKRIITLVVALATLAVPTVTAQKINAESYKVKLAKSDADIANPKKSEKAATWFNRGKVCVEAITAPTASLYNGIDMPMLAMTSFSVQPNEVNGNIYSYDWVDLHIENNKVVAWVVKKEILEGAYEIAREAFEKAYALDPALAPKIKNEYTNLIKYYEALGANGINLSDYKSAVEVYIKAATLQESPCFEKQDPRYYFYAGQLSAFLGSENEQYFIDGEKYLTRANELGYTDDQGNLYYFLFHCYYGQRKADKENLTKAKNALLEGIEKYPRNERIMEGLIQLYTSEDNVGDPADLVDRIEKMLAEKPDNVDLWFARGQVFFKLKNIDECLNSFLKINELKPNDYDTHFYLGYFYMAKGDEANRAFNSRLDSINSQEAYQAGLNEVNAAYMKALPWLEKAMELKPDSVDCAEYLKVLCFRLRNEEGVMDKYNKYNALFKQLKGM